MRGVRRWWAVLPRRYRFDTRSFVRPHQHDRARRVVDDETGRVIEASRAEPGPIPIASKHQDVDALRHGANDLVFGTADQAQPFALSTAQTISRRGKQLGSLIAGDIVETPVWGARPQPPAEQPERGSAGSLAGVCRGHMQQREPRIAGEVLRRRVDAPLPRALDDPDDDMHDGHLTHEPQ